MDGTSSWCSQGAQWYLVQQHNQCSRLLQGTPLSTMPTEDAEAHRQGLQYAKLLHEQYDGSGLSMHTREAHSTWLYPGW